jgi:hypothetical protein
MCVNSICIGFHLNGVNKAQQHALEMKSIMDEAPLIESDMEEKVTSKISPFGKSLTFSRSRKIEKFLAYTITGRTRTGHKNGTTRTGRYKHNCRPVLGHPVHVLFERSFHLALVYTTFSPWPKPWASIKA